MRGRFKVLTAAVEPPRVWRTLPGVSDVDAADWVPVRAGDPAGLAALFDRHEARLFRHACRLLTARQDAKDAKDAVTIAFLLMGADGSDQRLLVSGYRVGHGIGPVWSPDGNRVAFQRLRDTYVDESGTERACLEEHEVVVVAVNDHEPLGPAGTQTVIEPPQTFGGGQRDTSGDPPGHPRRRRPWWRTMEHLPEPEQTTGLKS